MAETHPGHGIGWLHVTACGGRGILVEKKRSADSSRRHALGDELGRVRLYAGFS